MVMLWKLFMLPGLALWTVWGSPILQEQDRAKVPEPEAQKEARELLRDIFREEYRNTSPAAQRSLADKLIGQADQTFGDNTSRYVLLLEARDLYLEGNDVQKALEVLGRMENEYAIDRIEVRQEVLMKASVRANPGYEAEVVARAMIELVKEAMANEMSEVADRVVRTAAKVARRAKNIPLAKEVVTLQKDLAQWRRTLRRIESARNKLKTDPENAQAHLEVGQYLSFYKGEWEAGLKHLANGSDAMLKEAARKDSAGPDEPDAQIAVGDLWWDLSKNRKYAQHEKQLKTRAKHWYSLGVGGLSGLHQLRIQKRLDERSSPEVTRGGAKAAGLNPEGSWVKQDTGTVFHLKANGVLDIPKARNPAYLKGRWAVSRTGVTLSFPNGERKEFKVLSPEHLTGTNCPWVLKRK